MKTLKERLTFARELRNLTQAELAKKSKCAQSAIGNVESGTRETLRNIVLVARALRVSADWLYDGKGHKPEKEEAQKLTATNPFAMPDAMIQANNSGPQLYPVNTFAQWPFEFVTHQDWMQLPLQERAELEGLVTLAVLRFKKTDTGN